MLGAQRKKMQPYQEKMVIPTAAVC